MDELSWGEGKESSVREWKGRHSQFFESALGRLRGLCIQKTAVWSRVRLDQDYSKASTSYRESCYDIWLYRIAQGRDQRVPAAMA